MSEVTLEQVLDAAKTVKGKQEALLVKHTELDGKVQKLHEEIEKGKVDAITQSTYLESVEKVKKLEDDCQKSFDQLNKTMADLMAKGERGGGAGQEKTLGQLVAEAGNAKNYSGGSRTLLEISGDAAKKAMTSDPASGGAFIQPYRRPGAIMAPDQPLTMRDLFPSIPITTNAVEWVLEKLFTNNAAVQAKEGDAKAQSDLTFELKTSPVATIAHWIVASRQVLADVPQLTGIIDTKLRAGLKLKEDEELLYGDGTNGSLLGLVPQATAYASAGIPGTPTPIDHIRWAILQVAKAKYPSTFGVMSLEDWAEIQLTKTTDGAYIFGSPSDGAEPRLWGKRIVESYGMTAGNFLVGSSLAATIWDREQITVRAAEQHGELFVKNMVLLLCEERLGFTVERPAAIVYGQFQ